VSAVKWNEARIERLQKEGRGSGELKDYRPWLEITDLSSQGVSHRVFSYKTQRTHHLLSNIELNFFYMLEWCQSVVDIREQFPLPRTATRKVAQELGVKHPAYPTTHIDTVMTVDFFVTRIRDGQEVYEAFDIKANTGVEDARSIEKLEITRALLEENGVSHYLVTESVIPSTKVKNLAWIFGGRVVPEEQQPVPGFFDDYCTRMRVDIPRANKNLLLNEYCRDFDNRFHVQIGTGLRVARILMAERILLADLTQVDLPRAKLGTFVLTGSTNDLRVVGGSR
jgi:hypothetical protein